MCACACGGPQGGAAGVGERQQGLGAGGGREPGRPRAPPRAWPARAHRPRARRRGAASGGLRSQGSRARGSRGSRTPRSAPKRAAARVSDAGRGTGGVGLGRGSRRLGGSSVGVAFSASLGPGRALELISPPPPARRRASDQSSCVMGSARPSAALPGDQEEADLPDSAKVSLARLSQVQKNVACASCPSNSRSMHTCVVNWGVCSPAAAERWAGREAAC